MNIKKNLIFSLFFLFSTSSFGQYYYLFNVVNANGSITKIKVATLKNPNPEMTMQEYYGVIHEEGNEISKSIVLVFSVSMMPTDDDGTIDFFVHQKVKDEMVMCQARYTLDKKKLRIIEKVTEQPYPYSDIKDTSPSRFYLRKQNEDKSLAIIKMYLSRYYLMQPFQIV